MSIAEAVAATTTTLALSGAYAYRGIRRGSVTARDLLIVSATSLSIAVVLGFYVFGWTALLGGNLVDTFTPELFGHGPARRRMFILYILLAISAGTGAVSLVSHLQKKRHNGA